MAIRHSSCSRKPCRLRRNAGTLVKEEKGQSTVEFAIVVPLLMLFLIGVINFGIIMFTYLDMNITAQEASRLAGLGKSDSEVIQYVKDHVSVEVQVPISPTEANREPGEYVTVTLTTSLDNLTVLFDQFVSSVNLSAKSTVRVE
ncbi:MAG TPA: TadE/TadG family type IV pilus assembly protein [Bacillales bacterium]|nr:TadE/TadG family type IV pilus assembly protein [Bacillales bacterium]